MNLGFLITSVLFLIFTTRYTYFWWFQANEYVKFNKKKRKEYRKKLFFMPQILMFKYYDQNPEFEIWINRLVGIIFVLAGILGIIVGIRGPF